MKKTISISLVVILLCFASCSFFSEDPQHDKAAETLITDATSLYSVTLSPLYSQIGSDTDGNGLQGTYRGVYDLQTFTADEAILPVRGGDWLDGGVWMALFNHTWQADNEIIGNAWNYLFREVMLCNNALQVIDSYQDLLTTEQLRTYTAEVRALRAMYYYYLLDLFARVPIVTETYGQGNELVQSERHEVFDFVWQELQTVINDLATDNSAHHGAKYGHITYPVAAFVLMKLALNSEIYTDDDWTDQSFPSGKLIQLLCDNTPLNAWQAVEYYANKISDLGYTLDADFCEPFSIYNETSKENIFTIPMSKTIYLSRFKNQFRSLHYQHGSALGYGGENGSCATLEALSTFGYNTAEQDKRFVYTFFADTVYVNSAPLQLATGEVLVYKPLAVRQNLTGSKDVATAGARMYKYQIDPKGIFDGTLRENDIVLFRYADVLLMLSEALARDGRDGSSALNLVRSRSGMGSREATLDNILAERMLELCWEGWRRQDMIRMRRFTLALTATERLPLAGEADDHGYTTVFPIPKSILDMNPNFTQNKGY